MLFWTYVIYWGTPGNHGSMDVIDQCNGYFTALWDGLETAARDCPRGSPFYVHIMNDYDGFEGMQANPE